MTKWLQDQAVVATYKGLFNSSVATTTISAGAPTFAKIMDSIRSIVSSCQCASTQITSGMLMHPGTALGHMVTATVKYSSSTASPLLDMKDGGESDGNVGSVTLWYTNMFT